MNYRQDHPAWIYVRCASVNAATAFVENNLVEAVIVRDLEQISRNSYLLVGVIEIFRRRDVYLITTECDLNTELINCGLERFAGDRFTRASFGKPRFDVRLPLMDQF